jgi:DNA mismatch endonuclease (patch repair protein)
MRRDPRIVSYNMSRIRGKNTKPELVLRSALHSIGLRYRLHARLPGHPDILFVRARVAVFVDGAFWHGRNMQALRGELKVHRGFWLAKIGANVARDRKNRTALRRLGFRVLRFWDDQILDAPSKCAGKVFQLVRRRIPMH